MLGSQSGFDFSKAEHHAAEVSWKTEVPPLLWVPHCIKVY